MSNRKSPASLRLFLSYSRSGLTVTVRKGRYGGEMVCRARGGGLDLTGVALGEAISKLFPKEIRKLTPEWRDGARHEGGLAGLTVRGGTVTLDGGVGRDAMLRVLEDLGFSMVRLIETGPGGFLLLCVCD